MHRFAVSVLLLSAGQAVSGAKIAIKPGDYIAAGLGISRDNEPSRSSTTTLTSEAHDATTTHRPVDVLVTTTTTSHTLADTLEETSSTTTSTTTSRTSSISTRTTTDSERSTTSSQSSSIGKTGSGMEYANSCNQALYSWTKSYVTYSNGVCTKTATQQEAAGEGDSHRTTKLCDGIPRMLPNFTTPSTSAVKHCKTHSTLDNAPPKPTCSIQPSDCAALMTSFSQAHGVPGNVEIVTHAYYGSIYKDYPRCVTRSDTCTLRGDVIHSPGCAVYGDGIQLFYWPQTWADGLCGKSKHAVTMGPTIPGKPNTATISGHALTSPTVYIKYDALYASDACSTKVGTVLKHGLIPMVSDEVSTKVPWFWTNIPWSGPSGMAAIAQTYGVIPAMTHGWPGINTDYADQFLPLQYPDLDVPGAEAYYAMRLKGMDCWGQGCPTMIPWQHHPVLAIPDKIRMMVPEWESCSLPWGAMNDPPVALGRVDEIAKPTRPAGDEYGGQQTTGTSSPTAIVASPCITPSPVTPTPTAKGVLTEPKAPVYGPLQTSKADSGISVQEQSPKAPYPVPQSDKILSTSAVHPAAVPITYIPISASKAEIVAAGNTMTWQVTTDSGHNKLAVYGSRTITAGASPVTIKNHVYSMGQSAIAVFDPPSSTSTYAVKTSVAMNGSSPTIQGHAAGSTAQFVYDPETKTGTSTSTSTTSTEPSPSLKSTASSPTSTPGPPASTTGGLSNSAPYPVMVSITASISIILATAFVHLL